MQQIDKKKLKQGCITIFILYLILSAAFYFIGDDQLKYHDVSTPMAGVEYAIGEITSNVEIKQSFKAESNIIDSVTFAMATYARVNQGDLVIRIINKSNNILSEKSIDITDILDNSNYTVHFDNTIKDVLGEELTLHISSPNMKQGNAITIYYNRKKEYSDGQLFVNDEIIEGELCFSINGKEENLFGTYYLYFVLVGGLLLVFFELSIYQKEKQGQKSFLIVLYEIYIKYKFLIKQLVSRDFKTKYKRSMLGFMWSFLNPLLTMVIQYIVFSTIFRSNIENFPVYLLTGSIIFNFFTESVGVGLVSIVMNASLINKVYVPKYIYPVTRVFSTAINLLISLLPLLFAIIITGENITKAYLLLPFVLICLTIFCIGMTFMLSSAMVFFRDTQFLWGIVSLLWMYATPLFYPENIIPERFSAVLKLNPMYYFIKFARIIILDGVSPQPIMYLYCLIFAFASLTIGAYIFKKSQDKFVLYL